MTPRLFHLKFMPNKTYFRALQLLNLYRKKEYVRFIEFRDFTNKAAILTRKALKEIHEKRLTILTNLNEVKVSFKAMEHHERVIHLRIALEKNPTFTDLLWVSDFEMACGIEPALKFKYRNLSVEERIVSDRKFRPKKTGKGYKKRIPDGYFEAIRNGLVEAYVFEYENSKYSFGQIKDVVVKLEKDYPTARKLIVSRTAENAARMNNAIWYFMHESKFAQRGGRPSLWFTTDYDHALSKTLETNFRKLRNPNQESKASDKP